MKMTASFYAEHAASFSSTRDHAWHGWERLIAHIASLPLSLTVLDAACGNLRFERLLAKEGIWPAHVHAIDACHALLHESAPEGMRITRIEADLAALAEGDEGFTSLDIPPCSLTVCFGFMHHLPHPALRRRFMEKLIDATDGGGICAMSFWQWRRDERLERKAAATRAASESARLLSSDENDGFLGWQDDPRALRFCHHFPDDEVDGFRRLAEGRGAVVIDDFNDDGKSRDLNRYLVLKAL